MRPFHSLREVVFVLPENKIERGGGCPYVIKESQTKSHTERIRYASYHLKGEIMLIEVQPYKKSINESNFSDEQIAVIWDFYVTKAIVKSAAQCRKIADYGLREIPWKDMLASAEVKPENKKVLLANSINKTLQNHDLEIVEGKGDSKHNRAIEIDVPKIVCLTPFSIADEEKPKSRVGEAESVLTHIRNSFAHGNTYFFDNGNLLLEDKNQGITTAMMILHQKTLLDWIAIVDPTNKFYTIKVKEN